MSDRFRIVYTPHRDVAAQEELAVLVAAYRFILDRHAEREDATRAFEGTANLREPMRRDGGERG